MPNNTYNIPFVSASTGQPNYGYVNQTPQQQPFGNVTTEIFTFFNTINYPVTGPAGNIFTFYGAVGNVTSSVDVSDYNNFAFQLDMGNVSGNATSSFSVSSSIDGLNFVGEFAATYNPTTTASVYRIANNARRRYFLAYHSGSGAGVATGSLYMLAGQ